MSRVVRTEVRKRGFFGKLVKLAFIAFNLLMAFWLVSGMIGMGEQASTLRTDAEMAGAGFGMAMGLGLILFVWTAGAVILGIIVALTRGKKTIVEEVVA